jgi:hypothetical protein
MARNNETATARVMSESDAPVSGTKELKGGKHITASALAMVLAGTSEERKLDAMRLSNLKTMLDGSTDDEINAAIRSAEKTEKTEDSADPVNYGPAVVKMVKLGMTLKTAKVRISETRAIVRAIRAGFSIAPKDGWHKTIVAARETLEQKAERDAKAERDRLALELRTQYQLEHGENFAAASKFAEAKLAELEAEAEAEEATKDVDRMVKRLQKLDNATLLAVIGKCAESIGYNVVKAESAPKSAKGKAKRKERGEPVAVPPMPAAEHADETHAH